MRAALATATAVVLAVVGAGCGGPDVTQVRVEQAVATTFANLYALQQALLGHPARVRLGTSAACRRSGAPVGATGAGADWTCEVLLRLPTTSVTITYELDVQADGCFSADGPPAIVGPRAITVPGGGSRVNPLFQFDGCFATG